MRKILSVLMFLILTSGCGKPVQESLTMTQPEPESEVDTPTPTITVVPFLTSTATSTLPPTYTPTYTVTPGPRYSDVELVSVSFVNGKMMISLDVPGIEGEYYGKINRNFYQCFYLVEYPERLYCSGTSFAANTPVFFTVFSAEDDSLGFALTFIVPNILFAGQGAGGGACEPYELGYIYQCVNVELPGCPSTDSSQLHGIRCYNSCGDTQDSCAPPVAGSDSSEG